MWCDLSSSMERISKSETLTSSSSNPHPNSSPSCCSYGGGDVSSCYRTEADDEIVYSFGRLSLSNLQEEEKEAELINRMMTMNDAAAAAARPCTINNNNPITTPTTPPSSLLLPNSTPTTLGSRYYLNNFELWNQHRCGDLVSGMQRLGLARREDNSPYMQGGSGYNKIREKMVQWLFYSPELFIAAAFHETGSSAVQNFIKLLKNSPSAFVATSILSTKCYELMTNNRGKHVIKQCLLFLGNEPNQVLFEKAIKYCIQLATHKEGCLSLNECISYISGSQRERLLQLIADQSAYLSHDPNGNFVVQHVLSVHNPQVTAEICSRLRGHYSQLSLNQRGSHVVEKCITWSTLGMTYAVQEFLRNEKVLCQIARNEFGNYVIQRALNTTKVSGIELYESLVNTLEANSLHIGNSKYGRKVINLMRGIIPDRRRMIGYRRASEC